MASMSPTVETIHSYMAIVGLKPQVASSITAHSMAIPWPSLLTISNEAIRKIGNTVFGSERGRYYGKTGKSFAQETA